MIDNFLKPETVSSATALKKEHGAAACYFGGGTLINNPSNGIDCRTAIDLSRLDLDRIHVEDNGLRIGARVTFQDVIDNPQVPEALKRAAAFLVSRQTRNMATIGGNIAARRTDSYLLPCLTALGARVQTAELGEVPMEDYLSESGPALILDVVIPNTRGRCDVRRFNRQFAGPAVMSAAMNMVMEDGKVIAAALAMGGVSPGAIRLSKIERQIMDGTLSTPEGIAQAVAQEVSPAADLLGSIDFKKHIGGILAADCFRTCFLEEA